ncbi:hypothetical protein TSAR_013677 [Trichomalopsis sarcophagae]|uniref:Uncharacterized protein n=1 Tax=Trichomalopsis sarcophagae TaxID=543379 RepID=A0A232EHP8_9HYME|nr:hypothetical protein TSAR_013677 [Trichomalopsis sarcophagae]
MAESSEEVEIKIEIQKLLGQINNDMIKLKTELNTINNLIKENASLPTTMKMVNEKLIITAKDAGIDIENLDEIVSLRDLEEDEDGARGGSDTVQSNDNASKQTSDVSDFSAATHKITERIKHALN